MDADLPARLIAENERLRSLLKRARVVTSAVAGCEKLDLEIWATLETKAG